LIRIRLSKSAILPVAALFFFMFLSPVSAQQDVASVIAQADDLYDTGEYLAATELIRPALAAAPGNYILLWKLADNIAELARIESENSTKDESEARYEEAVGFARQAIEVERDDAEGWY